MDGEAVAALAQATLSDAAGFFCAAAVCRPPEASRGSLDRLWCRPSPISASDVPPVEKRAVPGSLAASRVMKKQQINAMLRGACIPGGRRGCRCRDSSAGPAKAGRVAPPGPRNTRTNESLSAHEDRNERPGKVGAPPARHGCEGWGASSDGQVRAGMRDVRRPLGARQGSAPAAVRASEGRLWRGVSIARCRCAHAELTARIMRAAPAAPVPGIALSPRLRSRPTVAS